MESILLEAEKIINSSANKKDQNEYYDSKNAMLCGPFSETVYLLQKENRKIRQQIAAIRNGQNETLREFVIKNLVAKANEISYQKESDPHTVKEALRILIHSMRANETIVRSDMHELEDENKQLRLKIQETKSTKIKVKKINKKQLKEKKEHLENMKGVINDASSMIEKIEQQNADLENNLIVLDTKIKTVKHKYNSINEVYEEKREKYESSIAKKNYLIKEIRKVSRQAEKTALSQRYAGANFSMNDEQTRVLIALRKEIEKLTAEKESLKQDLVNAKLQNIKRTQMKVIKPLYV